MNSSRKVTEISLQDCMFHGGNSLTYQKEGNCNFQLAQLLHQTYFENQEESASLRGTAVLSMVALP